MQRQSNNVSTALEVASCSRRESPRDQSLCTTMFERNARGIDISGHADAGATPGRDPGMKEKAISDRTSQCACSVFIHISHVGLYPGLWGPIGQTEMTVVMVKTTPNCYFGMPIVRSAVFFRFLVPGSSILFQVVVGH